MKKIVLYKHDKTAISAIDYMQSIIDELQSEYIYTMKVKEVTVSNVTIPYIEIVVDNGIMLISLPVRCHTDTHWYNIKVAQDGTNYTISSVNGSTARGIFAYIRANEEGDVSYINQTEFSIGANTAYYFEISSYGDGISVVQRSSDLVMKQPFVMTYHCEYEGERCISILGSRPNVPINTSYSYWGVISNLFMTSDKVIESIYTTNASTIGVENNNPILLKSSIYGRPTNLLVSNNNAVTLDINNSMLEQRNVYDFFDSKGNTLLTNGQKVKLNGGMYIVIEKGGSNTAYCGYSYLLFKYTPFSVATSMDLIEYPFNKEPLIGELENTEEDE